MTPRRHSTSDTSSYRMQLVAVSHAFRGYRPLASAHMQEQT